MSRKLKKIATSFFLSGVLFSGSIVGYNSLAINNYYHNIDHNYSIQNKWNESIENYQLLSKNFKEYSYSETDFERDKFFFNNLYTPDYYMQGYDKKFHKGYALKSELDILHYLSVSLLYQNNSNDLEKLKSLLKTAAESNEDQFQNIMAFNQSVMNKNREKYSDTLSSVYTNLSVEWNSDIMTKINNINQLLSDNQLPPLFPDKEHQAETLNLMRKAIGNQTLYSEALKKQSVDFMKFVTLLKNKKLTKEQEYNFFKIISYTEYIFNQRAKIHEKQMNNYYAINSHNMFVYSTTHFLDSKTSINKDLQEKNNINGDF